MSETVYGICKKGKGRKEVMAVEDGYTKYYVDNMIASKWESYPKIVSDLQAIFHPSLNTIRMKFIGDIPIMLIKFYISETSFNVGQTGFSIPWPDAIQPFKQHIIDTVGEYVASCTVYGGDGLPFAMSAEIQPRSDDLWVILCHDGHGQSGWYQYTPNAGPLVLVFGAIPKIGEL